MNLIGTNIEIDPINRFKLAATKLHLSINLKGSYIISEEIVTLSKKSYV